MDAVDKPHNDFRMLVERLPILRMSQVFVALVCCSLLAIDVFQTWNAYQVRDRESSALLTNLARVIAQNAEDAIKQADTVLVALVERIEHKAGEFPKRKRLEKVLNMHVGELPKLHGLFIYDDEGHWIASSRNRVFNANNADREYFLYHKTHPDRAAYIGKPVMSRSTGEWVVPVSRRLNRPDGSFMGVALATLHMKYFRGFYDTFEIGKEGTILLAHANGALLAQRPFQENRLGSSLKETLLFREAVAANGNSGSYAADSTYFDDQERKISYSRIEAYPLLVEVTMSEEEIFREWWADAAKHLGITLTFVIALGLLGYLVTRQIGYRLNSEHQLRLTQNKLESLNYELEQMAWQDGLTGLANRRRFDIALNEEFNQAMRAGKPLSLIMLDVDHFKKYNDRNGHLDGDMCLRKIGQAIKSCIKRAGDIAARYGGEEMAVLLPCTDLADAVVVAERLSAEIKQLGMRHDDSTSGIVTVSCGVHALIPQRNQHIPDDLVQGADAALYAAKAAGRDQIISSTQFCRLG